MRIIPRNVPWITTHNPFDGNVGAAIYVSPAGVDDRHAVKYRNNRLIPHGPGVVCDTFPASGDGPLGLDAHAAIVKSPDPLTWELPDDYLTSTFWVNVRPHKEGLELELVSQPLRITTEEGEDLPLLHGAVIVLGTTKLDGGGIRVWFRYIPALSGLQPTSFRVEDTEDPTDVVPATVPANGSHDYYAAVFGLEDEADYTLRIVGLADEDETNLTTFDITGDNAGPDADVDLTADEW